MSILVCGGAGYIGSHTALELIRQGRDVIYLDNLQKGHRAAVMNDKFYEGDLRDEAFLNSVFEENTIFFTPYRFIASRSLSVEIILLL